MHFETPIYSALVEYSNNIKLRLHMPGHVGFGIMKEEFKDLADLDITEVPDIGDLHLPEGRIEAARKLLADAFNSKQSLFLVNGATSGIHTLFLALNSRNQKILIPRNMHRSIYTGLVLSGAKPVYISSPTYKEYSINLPFAEGDIEEILKNDRNIEAVFLTNPNYFGICADMTEAVNLIKRVNSSALVLVDEAHGGHFPFHNQYPKPALSSGADAVVNGLHKTLPVLNQGACLHIQNEDWFWQRVFPAWSMVTTSSPSYPIIASIDLARSFMVTKGHHYLERALELSQTYKFKINHQLKGIKVLTEQDLATSNGQYTLDPLKLLISINGLIINGESLAQILRHEYSIQVEMYTPQNVLAMMSIFHDQEDWHQLFKALQDIAFKYQGKDLKQQFLPQPPDPQVLMTPREAYYAAFREVEFKDCRGKIAGEAIVPYPPGIPCLLPGELISEEVFSYLNYIREERIPLSGIKDKSLKTMKIIEY